MFFVKLYNFIFGYVVLKITGDKPEKFINMLMTLRIKFWDIEKPNGVKNELYVKIAARHASSEETLEKIAQRSNTQCEIAGEHGMKFFMASHKYRLGIYVGSIIGAAIIYASTFFIWEVKITQSDYPDNGEILQILERYGCKNGAYIPKLDVIDIQNRAIIANGKISWIAINIKGTVANVEVRRRADAVEIVDRSTPANIVASKAGKIISVEAYEGQKIAFEGTTVQKGDLLISGAVHSNTIGMRIKHAMGKVMAETSRVIEVKISLNASRKEYTGASINKNSLNILGKNVNLYFNSGNSMEKYDRIKKTDNLRLFNVIVLPIKVTTTTYKEFVNNLVPVHESEAKRIAMSKIDDIIEREFGKIIIQSKEYEEISYGDDGEYYYLRCKLECIEDIAEEVPFMTNVETEKW